MFKTKKWFGFLPILIIASVFVTLMTSQAAKVSRKPIKANHLSDSLPTTCSDVAPSDPDPSCLFGVDLELIEGDQATAPLFARPSEVLPSEHGNVYFTPPSLSVGTASDSDATRSVMWADVDNDGDLDLAVGNDGGQNVIYLNDGSADLSTTVNFGTGSDKTYSLAWGDMNGDGHLDLAVGNYGGQNVVYLNDGSGNLSSSLNVGTGSDNTTSVAWADANHDGHLDLAVSNDGSQNVVYLNNGLGCFSTTANFGTGSDATQSMVWGDVDNDGHLDLVVGNYEQQNQVYLNDGNATFATSLTFGTGSDKTLSVGVGDLNGDGQLDISQTAIYETHHKRAYVHMNDGTGNFDARAFPTWPSSHSRVVAIADAEVKVDGEDVM